MGVTSQCVRSTTQRCRPVVRTRGPCGRCGGGCPADGATGAGGRSRSPCPRAVSPAADAGGRGVTGAIALLVCLGIEGRWPATRGASAPTVADLVGRLRNDSTDPATRRCIRIARDEYAWSAKTVSGRVVAPAACWWARRTVECHRHGPADAVSTVGCCQERGEDPFPGAVHGPPEQSFVSGLE